MKIFFHDHSRLVPAKLSRKKSGQTEGQLLHTQQMCIYCPMPITCRVHQCHHDCLYSSLKITTAVLVHEIHNFRHITEWLQSIPSFKQSVTDVFLIYGSHAELYRHAIPGLAGLRFVPSPVAPTAAVARCSSWKPYNALSGEKLS